MKVNPPVSDNYIQKTVLSLFQGYLESHAMHESIQKLSRDVDQIDKAMIRSLDSSIESGVLKLNTSYYLPDGRILTVVSINGNPMISVTEVAQLKIKSDK